MAKRKRPSNARVPASLRLAPEDYERLRQGPRGISEESRLRVEQSLERENLGAKALELADDVLLFVRLLEAKFDPKSWHTNIAAHTVLIGAIKLWLGSQLPMPDGAAKDLMLFPKTEDVHPQAVELFHYFRILKETRDDMRKRSEGGE
jgi:hypothetical protein